jgi:hypothetical protein
MLVTPGEARCHHIAQPFKAQVVRLLIETCG